jgi:hypothetical protein
MNAGERDELLIKLKLIEMRDLSISFFGAKITSVGFDGREYQSLPPSFSFANAKTSNAILSRVCQVVGIQKGAAFDKSDVCVNGDGYSLKSLSAAPPAIVNHTTRAGFEFACNHVGSNIGSLDVLINNYWKLRLAGKIREDVSNSDPLSPFSGAKDTLAPILQYFLFIGSGSRVSASPASFILDYSDPLNTNTWTRLDPTTAVDKLWANLVFSIRAKKGMPADYNPSTYTGKHAASIRQWVQFSSGEYRGALHIRVKY